MTFSFFHYSFSAGFYSSLLYPLNWGNWWRQNLSGDAHTSLTTLPMIQRCSQASSESLQYVPGFYSGPCTSATSWTGAQTTSAYSLHCEGAVALLQTPPEWLSFSFYLSGTAQPSWIGNLFQPLVPCTAVQPVDTNKSNPLSQSLVTEPMLCVGVSLTVSTWYLSVSPW